MKSKLVRAVLNPATAFYGGLALASAGASWVYPPAGAILFGIVVAWDAQRPPVSRGDAR